MRAVEARYAEVHHAMNRLCAMSWSRRSPAWVDDQLELVTAVVHQVGSLRGEYDDGRRWGDLALDLGGHGAPVRRADLMLHLAELYRVTGYHDRYAELVHGAVELLGVLELSPEAVDALAPVSCHALFCLGALTYWEGRPDEPVPLLSHAWTHGGDSTPHLWSLVNVALMRSDEGDDAAALALEDAAIAMAERLGDPVALLSSRNNRACTLRRLGRVDEAYDEFAGVLPTILADDVPDVVVTSCEDFACVLFDLGRDRDAAMLLGAAQSERDVAGVPRMALHEALSSRRSPRAGGAWATSGSHCSSRARGWASWSRWRPPCGAPSVLRQSGPPTARGLLPPGTGYSSSKTTTTEAVRSAWPGWNGIDARTASAE